MTHIAATDATANEYDKEMADKLERIKRDPEAYYTKARKDALHNELRRALMPWAKVRPRTA